MAAAWERSQQHGSGIGAACVLCESCVAVGRKGRGSGVRARATSGAVGFVPVEVNVHKARKGMTSGLLGD